MARRLLPFGGVKATTPFLLGCLVAPAVLGCAGDGFEADGDNQDQGAELESGAFLTIAIPTRNECSKELVGTGFPVADVELEVASNGRSFAYEENFKPIQCARRGDEFDCDVELDEIIIDDMTFLTTYELTLRGTAEHLEGTVRSKQTCTGEGCDEVAAGLPRGFPCRSEWSYHVVRAKPESFVPTVGAYDGVVGKPLNRCDVAPPLPADPALSIEARDDGSAEVSIEGDPTPLTCQFEGGGAARCGRTTERDDIVTEAVVDALWTSDRSFAGMAHLVLRCAEGKDCSDSPQGTLPCEAVFPVEGTASRPE